MKWFLTSWTGRVLVQSIIIKIIIFTICFVILICFSRIFGPRSVKLDSTFWGTLQKGPLRNILCFNSALDYWNFKYTSPCQEIGCRISVKPCEYVHLIKQKKHSQENLEVLTDQNKSTSWATHVKLTSWNWDWLTSASLCFTDASSRTMAPLLSCRIFLCSTSSSLAFTSCLCSLKLSNFVHQRF